MLHESGKESSGGRRGAGGVFLEASQGLGAARDKSMEIPLEMQPGIKETSTLGQSRRENIQPAWCGQLAL